MIRLTLSLLFLALAFWGQNLIRTAPSGAAIPARDGLIVLAVAGLLFALNRRPTAATPPPAQPEPTWPLAGRALTGAGLLLSLLAALLFAQQMRGGGAALLAPSLLWVTGVVALGAGGLWHGRPVRYALPAFRWRRDAAGRPVRLALGGLQAEGEGTSTSRGIFVAGLAGLILLAGVGLRLWQISSAPPECSGVECAVALRVLEWRQGQADLNSGANSVGLGLTVLGSLLFRLTEAGVQPLRWLTALLGILTLPLILALGRRSLSGLGGDAGGLLAMLLLAVNPLHIWFSRSATPLALAAPLLALHGWAVVRAGQSGERRWWALAGLSWGLFFVEAAPFRLFALIWLILWLLLLALSRPAPRGGMLLLAGLAALGGALPGLTIGAISGSLLAPLPPLADLGQQTAYLASALFQPGGLLDSTGIPDRALLDPLSASLAALGLGLLLGGLVRRRPGAGLGVGLLLMALAVLRLTPVGPPPAAFLLVIMPLLWAAAGAGVGELAGQFADSWRPLLRLRRLLAGVVGLALLVGSVQAAGFINWLGSGSTMPMAQAVDEGALGRYLARTLAEDPNVRILAPADLLDHPAAQLSLTSAQADRSRLLPLDPARHLPFAGGAIGDLIYIVADRNLALLDLLQQVYPAGQVESFGELGLAYRVGASALESAQGIRGRYFAGRDFGTDAQVQAILADGPLRFDWSQQSPLPRPFSVVWQGSLLVRTFGPHTFRVDAQSLASGATDGPVFSLELDGVLLVDSSMGVLEREVDLAAGLYRLVMAYRSGQPEQPPTDLVVTWTPPSGETTTLPRDALYSVVLPDRGLLGEYYATSDWSGPLEDRRKDQIIGPDREREGAYSVIWRGKLAAPVTGSYTLATDGNGFSQILVDGQPVVENRAGGESQFSPGRVSLSQGWHDLEIRYAPQANGSTPRQLELIWQPPDGLFDRVDPIYLLPRTAPIGPDELALPPPPAVSLPTAAGASPPGADGGPGIAVPSELPALELALVWETGDQCGVSPLGLPRGVAIDVLGERLYVADAAQGEIVILNLADGQLLGKLTSPLFQEPFDLALSAGGELWVLDATAQTTLRIQPASGLAEAQNPVDTNFYRPRGLDVDPTGLRFIADTGGARVVVLGAGGEVVGQLGGPDSALGAGQPVDVWRSPTGAVWVVTAEDGGLWRADMNRQAATLSRASSIDGPHLAGLADGTFFLTEPEQGRVVYFSAEGRPLGQVRLGEQPSKPVGIDARLYGEQIFLAVSDAAACRVSLFEGESQRLP